MANGGKVYLGADPEAFVAMSQDVIHLRGTNSTCSSNKTDAIAAILEPRRDLADHEISGDH